MILFTDSLNDLNNKLLRNLSCEVQPSRETCTESQDFKLANTNKPTSSTNSGANTLDSSTSEEYNYDQNDSNLERRLSRHLEQFINKFLKSKKEQSEASTKDQIKPNINEMLDDKEEFINFTPLRRLSQNLEQVINAFLKSEKEQSEKKVKEDQIKANINEMLHDKKEFKKFKKFVRNKCVTTNVGAQQLIMLYADSKDAMGTEQTNYLVKNVSLNNCAKCVRRITSFSNLYRVEKDDKAGYKWTAPGLVNNTPIRRRSNLLN